MMQNPLIVKPVATGVAAAALDRFVLQQPDFKRSAHFGGSVAVGTAAATLATPIVPNFVPMDLGDGISGKTVSARVVEIGLGTGSSWAINKYLLHNEVSREDWTKRVAVIAAADFIGEYAADYMSNKPLSFFK
jgi:hypothetical protein